MKALVVEDDFLSRKILLKFLTPYFDCDVATDGDEALEAFKYAFNNNDKYDAVFLDIMMPKKNGLEVLQEIREFEHDKDIMGLDGAKIIMTTALDDSKNVLSAFKKGCEGYIVKPYQKEIIIEKLEELGLTESQLN
ncbi:MAG: response regulator [Calditrichaeota bacterium]|nr:response regulator [Calditrichota bacterium]